MVVVWVAIARVLLLLCVHVCLSFFIECCVGYLLWHGLWRQAVVVAGALVIVILYIVMVLYLGGNASLSFAAEAGPIIHPDPVTGPRGRPAP